MNLQCPFLALPHQKKVQRRTACVRVCLRCVVKCLRCSLLRRLFQQCRSHLCPCTERLKRSPHHSKLRYSASLHACKSMRNTQLVSLFGKTSNSNRAHKHKSSTKSTAAFIKTEIQKPQPQQKSQMQPPTVEQHQSQHSQKAETTPTNATAPMGFSFVPPVPPAAFCPSSQQCFGRIAFWTKQRGVPFVMNSPIFVIENHGNVSFVNLVNMTAPPVPKHTSDHSSHSM